MSNLQDKIKEVLKNKDNDFIVVRDENGKPYQVIPQERYLELTTPPTEQEVCEALSKWTKGNIPDIWNYKVYYDTGGFHYYNNCDFEEYLVEYEQIDKAISLSVFLPPHIITLIGRFYEGKVEDND